MSSSTAPFSKDVVDVLVIGGGYAGLSAALTLYRATHSTIVFDSSNVRDPESTPTRLLPSWEGQDLTKYRAVSRLELEKTGLSRFVDVAVTKVEETEEGLFRATDVTGAQWLGRKVVLATGVEDVFPDIEGYSECWVTGIFPCMFQFGFEERGCANAGILAYEKLAGFLPQCIKLGDDANKFAKNITIYTNGNHAMVAELNVLIGTKKFTVEPRAIKRLSKGPTRAQVIIEFVDGESKTEDFLVHQPFTRQKSSFASQLKLDLIPSGEIKVAQPFPVSSHPGVYAAGDCASPFKIAAAAIAAGVFAGNGVAREMPIMV